MSDPKRTISGIRAFLASGQATTTVQPRTMAAEYAEMCREANFRLRRCADFLREGLRGEALGCAKAKPPLLDLVSALQFQELPDWERTCTAMDLPRPGRLALETTGQLLEAARRQQPLEELLAKYRYLSLARAAASQRLAILRQLISLDAASACWRRDAEELESARLAELRSEASAAARRGDIVQVHKLLDELNTSPWLTPIPVDLQEILSRASTALTEAAAVAKLNALLPRIRAAGSAMSYEQGRQVFAEWGGVVKESKITVPPELRAHILPLARWLDEQDDRREQERQFRDACADLAAAIKSAAPLEQLTALQTKVAAFRIAIPDDLFAAYRRAYDAARREHHAEKHKQYLLAAVLVVLILAALGALAYVIFSTGK